MASDVDDLNPAHRAEQDIADAAENISETKDVIVVDENIKKLQEQRAKEEQRKKAESEAVTEVSAERVATPILEYMSTRNRARVLIVTSNQLVYEKGSEIVRHLLELEQMFAEVHVIVVGANRSKPGRQRIGESVWIYASPSRAWWRVAFDARATAKKELSFSGGFRPDIVIAEDPFEAGLAGFLIAKRYERPFQVHVKVDFIDETFRKRHKKNKWRVHIANYVLKRIECVRTQTAYMQKRIIEKYHLTQSQVEVLPIFYDIAAWKEVKPIINVKRLYPKFKFVLLHVSAMNEFSHTDAVIDGLFYILRQYPTIGLVIVGNGPDREELEARVRGYKLSEQIKFETGEVDVLSFIKTSQVLIHTSEETTQDKIILQAAISEVPIICGNVGLASELFVDEESVLLCPVDSPPCFGEKVNRILNQNPLRQKLAMNAESEVTDRMEQDYGAYMGAYQGSIERCLVATDEAPVEAQTEATSI